MVHHLEGRNLRFDVKRAVLDLVLPDRRPVSVPTPRLEAAARMRRFAGTYRANNYCHTCPDGGPNVQDFEVQASGDCTISVWDDRWVEVSPMYFVRADGHGRLGFTADSIGRIVALTAGSWRVVERSVDRLPGVLLPRLSPCRPSGSPGLRKLLSHITFAVPPGAVAKW